MTDEAPEVRTDRDVGLDPSLLAQHGTGHAAQVRDAVFSLEGVNVHYGAFQAVRDISFASRTTRSPRSSGRPAAGSPRSCGASTA